MPFARVDDVEDNSTLRRGYPVAHSIFGVAQTINTGNYVYFRALEEILKLNSPPCIQVFAGTGPHRVASTPHHYHLDILNYKHCAW